MTSNAKSFTKDITFNELSEEWLLYKKHRIKKSTYYRYKYIISKYLKDEFTGKYLYELEYINYNSFIDSLMKLYQIKTVRDIVVELKAILKYAERKYGLDLKMDLITMPRLQQNKVMILSKYEEKCIKEFCVESIELRDVGILLCLYTGIRIGEISALLWENIDLENNLLYINKTMERIYISNSNTIIYIGEPKSKSSVRTIPLVNNISKILKELKEKNNFPKDSFFLTGSSTRFVEPRNYQYWFNKRLEELGISPNKFHILRHTFATNCIQIGMDAKSLSEILGHSNVSITLNRYVHSSYEVKKNYLEKL